MKTIKANTKLTDFEALTKAKDSRQHVSSAWHGPQGTEHEMHVTHMAQQPKPLPRRIQLSTDTWLSPIRMSSAGQVLFRPFVRSVRPPKRWVLGTESDGWDLFGILSRGTKCSQCPNIYLFIFIIFPLLKKGSFRFFKKILFLF